MVSLHFGALCKPIEEQLNEQGFTLEIDDDVKFQKIADAITLIHLHGILPDGMTSIVHKKLFKEISKHVREVKK